jgi:sRNA-binding carbon storage regulator CsrA
MNDDLPSGLTLTVKPSEKVKIGDDIEVFLVPFTKGTGDIRMPRETRICIRAPRSVRIIREPMNPAGASGNRK